MNSKEFFPTNFVQEEPIWKHSQEIFNLALLRIHRGYIYPDLLKTLETIFLSPQECYFFLPIFSYLPLYSNPNNFLILAYHLLVFRYYLDLLLLTSFLKISVFFRCLKYTVLSSFCFFPLVKRCIYMLWDYLSLNFTTKCCFTTSVGCKLGIKSGFPQNNNL